MPTTEPTTLDIDALEANLVDLRRYLHHDRSEMDADELEALDLVVNAAPELLAIARAVKVWSDARTAKRGTQAAVNAAGTAHYADRRNVLLCEAWEQAGNANLIAHDVESRAFSDLCRLADRLAGALK